MSLKQTRKSLALLLFILGSLSFAVRTTGPWPAVAADKSNTGPMPQVNTRSQDHGWNAYLMQFCEARYDRASDLWMSRAGMSILALPPCISAFDAPGQSTKSAASHGDAVAVATVPASAFVFVLPVGGDVAYNKGDDFDCQIDSVDALSLSRDVEFVGSPTPAECRRLDVVVQGLGHHTPAATSAPTDSPASSTPSIAVGRAMDDFAAAEYDLGYGQFMAEIEGSSISPQDGTKPAIELADTSVAAPTQVAGPDDSYNDTDWEDVIAAEAGMIEVAPVEPTVPAESKPVAAISLHRALPAAELWLNGPVQSATSAGFSGCELQAGVPVARLIAPPSAAEYVTSLSRRVGLAFGFSAMDAVTSHTLTAYDRALRTTGTRLFAATRQLSQPAAAAHLPAAAPVIAPQIGTRPAVELPRKATRPAPIRMFRR